MITKMIFRKRKNLSLLRLMGARLGLDRAKTAKRTQNTIMRMTMMRKITQMLEAQITTMNLHMEKKSKKYGGFKKVR